MSEVLLIGTYVTGYTVAAGVDIVVVEPGTTIGGAGLVAPAVLHGGNLGTIAALNGAAVALQSGGNFANLVGGQIAGTIGIQSGGASATLANYGQITATGTGVLLQSGSNLLINGNLHILGAELYGREAAVLSAGTVENLATILGETGGVMIAGAGTLLNGTSSDTAALIQGGEAVGIAGTGTVANDGRILGTGSYGVSLSAGGSVVNGSIHARDALIAGGSAIVLGGTGAVGNFGTVHGYALDGVSLAQGGSLGNGTNGDPTALIEGPTAVAAGAAASVANYGTLWGYAGNGVVLAAGGGLSNGSVTDTSALVEGYSAIAVAGAAASIGNFGTVLGIGPAGDPAIGLAAGGTVTNGRGADTTALIAGVTGIDAGGPATIGNFGTVDGRSGYGIVLRAGGSVTNGWGSDPLALIEGAIGVELMAGGTLTNDGTIAGTGAGGQSAAYLRSSGLLLNGGAGDTDALIAGYDGLQLQGGSIAENYGTIRGSGVAAGVGAVLGGGSLLANGSALDRAAVIAGVVGLEVFAAATIGNFGTIAGTGGTAVLLESAADLLVDVGGAVFDGLVEGGGGTLALAPGTGTLAGLGSSFSGFGRVTVEAGGSWTLAGANRIAAGTVLSDDGTLAVTGTLVNQGSVSGALTLLGGTLTNAAHGAIAGSVLGATLPADVANLGTIAASGVALDLAGGGRIVDGSAGDTRALIEGGTGIVLGGPGTVVAFGTIAGSGTALRFDSAADLLVLEAHAVLAGKVVGGGGTLALAAGGGTLSGLGGSIAGFGLVTVAGAWQLAGPSALAAGTTLEDLDAVALGGTLSNAGTIEDAGTLVLEAGGALVNQAGAVLDLTRSTGIAGSGPAALLTNAGLVAKTGGTGTSMIAVKVVNSGTIAVASGTLDLTQAVSGTGMLELEGGGTLEAGAVAAGQQVAFAGGGESLVLAAPGAFAGALAGFAAGDTLDLRGFAAQPGESAVFTADGAGTGGTLTIADGAKSFSVALFGQYVAAGFVLAGDGHGGTAVTYVPPPAPSLAAATER